MTDRGGPAEGHGPVEGRTLVGGRAEAPVAALGEPLSFWGGLDPATGDVVDRHHPQRGARITGRVLLMPAGRGSSSSSSVLAEALRAGTGPAAIVLAEPDAIVALGAIVARELYGVSCPVVAVGDAGLAALRDAARVTVEAAEAGASVAPSAPGGPGQDRGTSGTPADGSTGGPVQDRGTSGTPADGSTGGPVHVPRGAG